MSALGVLPRVDYAVHADTGWERTETYQFAEKWTPWLKEHGIPVVIVQGRYYGKGPADRWVTPPFYTRGPGGDGQLYRTCTNEWKIRPMERWVRKRRDSGHVEEWIGFTLDEAHRAKVSRVGYMTLVHPYLEMLDRPWTRGMVVAWLEEKGLGVPVKSSCVICPFRRPWQWREMQLSGNGDWERAVEVDRAIRHMRPDYECYLCDDRRPLEDHDFTRQMELPW